jgi:hypothetical protein
MRRTLTILVLAVLFVGIGSGCNSKSGTSGSLGSPTVQDNPPVIQDKQDKHHP